MRPGLDDNESLENLIRFWLTSQDDLKGQLTKVSKEIKRLTRSRMNPHRLERLRLQALHVHELMAPVDAILSDLIHGTQLWLTDGGMQSVYHAGQTSTMTQLGLGVATFSLPHRAAAEVIAKDTYRDVLAATRYVDRDRKDLIRRIGKELTTINVGAGSTSMQGARRMADRLGKHGIGTVTYKNGARYGVGSYTEMLMRTKTNYAYNSGALNQARELGIKYVEILDGIDCGLVSHNDPDRANGMIVPLRVAEAYPASHPACTRSFAARPDVTKAQVSSGNWRSVVLPEAQASQTAFEKAMAAQGRKVSDGKRLKGVSRRPRRDRGSSARERAEKRLKEQQDAKRAKNRVLRKRQLVEAKKIMAEQIAVAEKANLGIDPAIMRNHGVTAQQVKAARPLAKQARADIRALASQQADEMQAFLYNRDLDKMTRPKGLRRIVDPHTGRKRSVRDQAGYDWLENLDDPTRGRVNHRWTESKLYSPDVVAEQVRNVTARNFTDDEAIDWLVDQWLREDSLRSIASGRIPKYAANLEDLLPPDFAAEGYRLESLWSAVPDEAAGHMAAVQKEQAQRWAAHVLPDDVVHGPKPWKMAIDDYVFELEYLDEALSNATPIGTDGLGASVFDEYIVKSAERLKELAPRNLDLAGTMNPFEMHEEMRLIAQAADWD